MRYFTFTVDDNIRFLRDVTAWSKDGHAALFDHPYLAMWKRLHDAYGVKIQLNLFYECEDFDLSRASARYRPEFEACADWLRLSFHSKKEFPAHPYKTSGYKTLFCDCQAVHREIVRFAGKQSLARTTTVHYAEATGKGVRALRDCGMRGLLGLFGTEDAPRTSYDVSMKDAAMIRQGVPQRIDGVWHFPISGVLNLLSLEQIGPAMDAIREHPFVGLMIHEQYFYEDYPRFQADFEEKVIRAVGKLCEAGRISCFAEELCEDTRTWN